MSALMAKSEAPGLPAVAAPQIAVTSRYSDELERVADLCNRGGAYNSLMVPAASIPDHAVVAIIQELETVARPSQAYAQRAAVFLASSWPRRQAPDNAEIYMTHLVDAMCEAPADLIVPAIKHLVRHARWLPAVADFVETIDDLAADRAGKLRAARRIAFWRAYHAELTVADWLARQTTMPAPPGQPPRGENANHRN